MPPLVAKLPWMRTPLPYPCHQPDSCGKYSAQRYAWLSSFSDDVAFQLWHSGQVPPLIHLGVPGSSCARDLPSNWQRLSSRNARVQAQWAPLIQGKPQAPPLDRSVPGVHGADAGACRVLTGCCSQGKPPRAPLIQMASWWTRQAPTEVRAVPWNGPGPCPPTWTAAWDQHVGQLVARGRWELQQSGRWSYCQLR